MSLATLDFGPLTETIQFLMEIDKLKDIQRRTKVIASLRQENSAEHSWHFAVAAMSLAPYAGSDVDINRVIKMALLHDIVEIDAGDIIVYDLVARAAIHEQEVAAAKRLFGMLPPALGTQFIALWDEYEAEETAEARFATVLDRILPMLINLHTEGQSWIENGIRLQQVLERHQLVAEYYPEIWQHLLPQLQVAQQKGWLK